MAELVWAPARDPGPLAALILGFLAVQALGMGTFGVETWTRRADPFGVWFGLVARLAPVRIGDDGTLFVRAPLAGAATEARSLPGTPAVVVAAIGVTAFDGARAGDVMGEVVRAVQDALVEFGLGAGAALDLALGVGLALAIAVVAALYLGGVAPMGAAGARAFAHTLLPVAAAYLVAHYFSLLAFEGQRLPGLVAAPIDGADPGIDYGVVSATGIWYVQVGALVLGHVGGLALAHDRALVFYGDAREALRSQLAMLGAMIAFTCLGLYVLSSVAT